MTQAGIDAAPEVPTAPPLRRRDRSPARQGQFRYHGTLAAGRG